MQIRLELPDRKLEASGTVILPGGSQAFSIHLDDVELAIKFVGDEDNPKIDPPEGDAKRFAVTLVNWNNPLGTTWYVPDIVDADGKSIDVALNVTGSGARASDIEGNPAETVTRAVSYSIYSRVLHG